MYTSLMTVVSKRKRIVAAGSILLLAAAQASMVPNGQARAFTLSEQWASYSFTIKTGPRTKGFQLELPEGGQAEFRKLKLSTPEGTVMIEYPIN
ncbi:MAG: hypothetical protein P8M62_10835 [Opitutae bacterium]|nr:hypothetical protein [Opitutae bacterium]